MIMKFPILSTEDMWFAVPESIIVSSGSTCKGGHRTGEVLRDEILIARAFS